MTLPQIHAFQDDALGFDDATRLAERLAAGEVSAVELVEASFERLAKVNDTLHAVVCENRDAAVRKAKKFDAHPNTVGFGCLPSF